MGKTYNSKFLERYYSAQCGPIQGPLAKHPSPGPQLGDPGIVMKSMDSGVRPPPGFTINSEPGQITYKLCAAVSSSTLEAMVLNSQNCFKKVK